MDWIARSLLASSISSRAGDEAGQVGDRRPTGVAGWTPLVKQSSAMYMLPMPARLRWSSSACADRAVGLAAQPAQGLVLVPVGAEQVGTEVADEVGLVAGARTSSTMPREKPTAVRPSMPSTTRTWLGGRRHLSPVG